MRTTGHMAGSVDRCRCRGARSACRHPRHRDDGLGVLPVGFERRLMGGVPVDALDRHTTFLKCPIDDALGLTELPVDLFRGAGVPRDEKCAWP